jgi:hypothetical protein
VKMQFHCADRPVIFYLFEESFGKFIGGCGSPLVCTHPLIQRISNNHNQLDCYLAATNDQSLDIEGDWRIFNAGDKYQYSGMVQLSKLDYHQWGDFSSAIGDLVAAPIVVHLSWKLDTSESYEGIGIYEDSYMCAVWATVWSKFPMVALYRVDLEGYLQGYWWAPGDFGIDEFIPLKRTDSDIHNLHNDFAVVRSFHEDGPKEYSSQLGSASIRYNPIFQTFRLSLTVGSEFYVGKAMHTGNHLCVVWRG